MPQSGGHLVFHPDSYQRAQKVLGPHGPTSSAESSDSPTGLFTNSCNAFAASLGMHGGASEPVIAAAPSADPVQVIRQGLSQLAPAQLAELQVALRQQRLERQQHDFLSVLSRVPPVAPTYHHGSPRNAPCSTVDTAPTYSMLPPAAPLPVPAPHIGVVPQADAAQLALLQGAATNLIQQLFIHKQLCCVMQVQAAGATVAGAPLGMPMAEPQQQQQQRQPQQLLQEPWLLQHPGVSASRAARNTLRRRGDWHTARAALHGHDHQQQPASAGAAADKLSTDEGARMQGRFAPALTAALWQQLQQLEQEEQACHVATATAQTAQRKSSRARKRSRGWDISSNNGTSDYRSSPDAAAAAAATAAAVGAACGAAASADRAGSADSTGTRTTSVNNANLLTHQADAEASKQRQQKRVRFALADDLDALHADEQTEEEEEEVVTRPKVVRRIGVRAQARKRMHKRTARRRRPMRAPLN